MATLEKLLRGGELGPIRIGMRLSEIKTVLGHPTSWGGFGGRTDIASFGLLQLVFRFRAGTTEGQLENIGLLFAPETEDGVTQLTPPSVWPLADFQNLSSHTTLDQFLKFLDGIGLRKSVEKQVRDETMTDLFAPPGTWVTFHDGKLRSIHYIAPAPAKKQISVSVSDDTLRQLTDLAMSRKKPVSAICAEWIAERAGAPHQETSSS